MYGNKYHNNSIVKRKQQFILLTTNFTIMNMEKEMKYVAPAVEVLEVEMEKGFQASGEFDIEDGD